MSPTHQVDHSIEKYFKLTVYKALLFTLNKICFINQVMIKSAHHFDSAFNWLWLITIIDIERHVLKHIWHVNEILDIKVLELLTCHM